MRCLVCHKEFQTGPCPRCGYPVVESTDVDALMELLRPQIEEYRTNFLQGVRVALQVYYWMENGESLVIDRKETMPFGSYADLAGSEFWLPQYFARIPDLSELELTVQIESGETVQELQFSLPNLKKSSLQHIGIEAAPDMRIRLKLKNDLGDETASQWAEIL